ncbi:MAG: large conductance mechanosensitive channel protein MscL [Zymomonas mobilis subsp. pomaceae]|uniref:Large-conductance mechanosensitive channel n=1 Tax=Zymomonas mobilis subsp. pomaceae (strain ATCC 29192 / DSM 22645 / JCM 10191 / CCUG 17912 / NBRC 13757 / NCIMB 11200 / NRRL B-4491 / Barker I) TaxID=579138 RepID=F8EU62_ZYMMT|nr:large conductance mechanosensitive channel protein MscL [Zymomonas mobilis]AEI37142.1 large conductance mechanosensitive channel protein [Zymomonas mobilis subsp. pomaceae ATCC 29192]MDX5948513.1 large conductance mechanosensitive channel protein MscL [Zymomonas mobilis subsp. pomaceae]GEB89422.1 large-conductance mechanosensitive channel [Zymomonas mobilis subsp. pomaceae]
MSLITDFKNFISKGNVLGLGIAVIMGDAFNKIISSVTGDLLMPIIGAVFGGVDFSGFFIRLGAVPANYTGSLTSYNDLKKAGVPLFGYGAFLTVVVNFVIVAFILFLIMKAASKLQKEFDKSEDKKEKLAEQVSPPENIVLLREIRDELRNKK